MIGKFRQALKPNFKKMETKKFKTNAKCGGCVAQIAESLNKILPREQWDIDLNSTDKILYVTSDQSDAVIIKAVSDAGFKAEKID